MKEIWRSMNTQLAPWRNQTLISIWQHMHAKCYRRAARIHLPAAAQLFILPRLPEGSVSSHILYRGAPSLAVCPSVHLCLPCGLGMAWQCIVKLFTCCCVVSVSLLNRNQKGPRHVCLEQHCLPPWKAPVRINAQWTVPDPLECLAVNTIFVSSYDAKGVTKGTLTMLCGQYSVMMESSFVPCVSHV